MFKIGLYARVSTTDQARVQEGSLISQEHRLRELIKSKNLVQRNWGEVSKVYVEEKSAKDTNRAEFQKMLSDVKAGAVNLIMVTELSRLSRNMKDFCNLWDFLQNHNTQFLSLRESFDSTTAAGRMMIFSCINFAQFEREQTGERLQENFRSRALRGFRNGGQPPLGYDRDSKHKGLLAINKTEAEIAKDIFDIFLKTGSLFEALKAINNKGYKSKEFKAQSGRKIGGNHFVLSTLHNLLTNFTYAAKVEVNKKNKNHPSEKELAENKRYKIVQAKWKPIIPIFLQDSFIVGIVMKRCLAWSLMAEIRNFITMGINPKRELMISKLKETARLKT